MTRHVIAVIRHIVIQAARDDGQADDELRGSIMKLLRDLAASDWQAILQPDQQPSLIQATERFVGSLQAPEPQRPGCLRRACIPGFALSQDRASRGGGL